MSKPVNIVINGAPYVASSNQTVLEAAQDNDIFIPRLCYLKDIHEEGNCRLCSIKINDQPQLKPACRTIVSEGMRIITDDQDIYDYTSMNLSLLANKHHFECFKCSREDNCEFLDLLRQYDIETEFSNSFELDHETYYHDTSGVMVIDSSKCILCGRCVSACEKLSGLGIISFNERGSKTYVGTAQFHELKDAGCIYCGKCIQACPTGALSEKDDVVNVERALRDPSKTVVVQVAPAVRVALGESFGMPIGTNVEGQMFEALRCLGFDEIFDTNFAADLTIMEEGNEFLKRIQQQGVLPMFTSCSPGWINYLELYHPEYLPNLSSCKSPQQMTGALIKTFYAEKMSLDPKQIVSVSIMPCIAKKGEARRKDMGRDGYQDVDYVLTTREFSRLIKRHRLDLNQLPSSKPFGMLAGYTGAGAIFGATGGVMEAALRTVSEILEEKPTMLDFKAVRGHADVKEASYTIAGQTINVAVVHGGIAIKMFLDYLKDSSKQYHFVEFMGCTGGCINGGGQPIVPAKIRDQCDVRELRAHALYAIDRQSTIRKSHKNPFVIDLYETFLGSPNSPKAHALLHTHYTKRTPYEHI